MNAANLIVNKPTSKKPPGRYRPFNGKQSHSSIRRIRISLTLLCRMDSLRISVILITTDHAPASALRSIHAGCAKLIIWPSSAQSVSDSHTPIPPTSVYSNLSTSSMLLQQFHQMILKLCQRRACLLDVLILYLMDYQQ